MKNAHNTKISNALKKAWKEHPENWLQPRTTKAKNQQSQNIKQHYKDHPEHKTAISQAQTKKWIKIRRAIAYCQHYGVNLEDDFL